VFVNFLGIRECHDCNVINYEACYKVRCSKTLCFSNKKKERERESEGVQKVYLITLSPNQSISSLVRQKRNISTSLRAADDLQETFSGRVKLDRSSKTSFFFETFRRRSKRESHWKCHAEIFSSQSSFAMTLPRRDLQLCKLAIIYLSLTYKEVGAIADESLQDYHSERNRRQGCNLLLKKRFERERAHSRARAPLSRYFSARTARSPAMIFGSVAIFRALISPSIHVPARSLALIAAAISVA